MHGIQQLFRQHALEKETSIDGWSSSTISPNSENSSSRDISIMIPNANWEQGNKRSAKDNKMGCNDNVALSPSSDKVLNQLHLASSPQPVPMTKHLRSPDYSAYNNGSNGTNRRAAYGRSPHNHVQEQSLKRNTPSRKTSCEQRSNSPASQNVSLL